MSTVAIIHCVVFPKVKCGLEERNISFVFVIITISYEVFYENNNKISIFMLFVLRRYYINVLFMWS